MLRRTKIVCTIGPATDTEEALARLVGVGMDVARLNFSHGTHDYHRSLIRRIKNVREELRKPVAILQDLQGPKIRVGAIKGGATELISGQQYILTSDPVQGDGRKVGVSLKSLPHEVHANHSILLSDGNIELRVERVAPPDIICRVVVGGVLGSRKGINLPSSQLHVDSLTPKDRLDIRFGVQEGVDAVALSFVRVAADIHAVRKVLAEHGAQTPIVAKIEKHEAVSHIDEIVAAADAVMVARGDLGVEIELERVPLVQKEIIRKCNAAGKPAITATQMLVRMVENPRPTRAEATDVANAVLDGTDAVMLSEETAIGKYPLDAVAVMDRLVLAAEAGLDQEKFERLPKIETTRDSLARAAYQIAKEIQAAAIVVPTWSGSTAMLVSRYRPKQPVIAATPNESAFDFLSFAWGVVPIRVLPAQSTDDVVALSIAAAHRSGHIRAGERVVVTGGVPNAPGTTNFIKVERVEQVG